MKRFEKKVWFVTGGTLGIGLFRKFHSFTGGDLYRKNVYNLFLKFKPTPRVV